MKRLLITALFVSLVSHASALTISEIMYDPQGANTGRDWIEVYNDTGSAITLTSWKFFESGVNHGITAYQGGNSLSANTYAVIADTPIKFLADYPNYQGILFDSSFSLPVTGEAISMKETSSAAPTFTIDYTPYVALGGNNDGSTLAYASSSWVRGTATPGAVNVAEEKAADATSSATSTGASNQTVTIPQMTPPSPDIVFYMPSEKVVVAGADSKLDVAGLTRAGAPIDDLRFTWAFGDGGQGTGSSTLHTYVYTGRYVAQVYGSNSYIAGTGRMTVLVVPPDLTISEIGQGKYGAYVDVTNPNAYDLDVSGWMISINGAAYPFPPNTIVAANSKTRFAGSSMGFAGTNMGIATIVKILFPSLEEVARYVPPQESLVNIATTTPVVLATVINRTYAHPVQKIVLGVSTTTAPQATSTPPVNKFATKDTRIVSWIKSVFRFR